MVLFEAVLEAFPTFKKHISADAHIVHNKSFENIVYKTIIGSIALTEEEKREIEVFRFVGDISGEVMPSTSFAEAVLVKSYVLMLCTPCTAVLNLLWEF